MLYKRQVRFMRRSPALHGVIQTNTEITPWMDEEKATVDFKNNIERMVQNEDPWYSVVTEERFVRYGNENIKLRYIKDDVNKIIDENNLDQVSMLGVYDALSQLKPVLESVYESEICHLDRWDEDCMYHGWDWSKDDGSMANMKTIMDGIVENFMNMYAFVLAGIGERIE